MVMPSLLAGHEAEDIPTEPILADQHDDKFMIGEVSHHIRPRT